MTGLSHTQRSNTLPPTIALLALAVWQCHPRPGGKVAMAPTK
jgi:hypothetical protein